jgi:O-acetylserine/cysteine efflux transporter
MKASHFGLLFVICFVGALNLVLTRWTVTAAGVPPVFFAAVRLAGVAVLLAPFLSPPPQQMVQILLISMGVGSLHFALLFAGLANAPAGAAAIIGQLGVPITALLSLLFLGERISARRAGGIALGFAGVMIIAFDPSAMSLSLGAGLLVMAAVSASAGNVLMKRTSPLPAMSLQAWIGLLSAPPLLLLSALTETGQVAPFLSGDIRVWLSAGLAILLVSIFGHGGFYWLLKRYDVSLLSPLTLMTPLWGLVLATSLLSEPVTPRLLIGAVISVTGVAMIVVPDRRPGPEAGRLH